MEHNPMAVSENRKAFMTVRLSPGLSPRSSLESTYCLLKNWVTLSWTMLQEKEKKEAADPTTSYTTHPHTSHFRLIKEHPKVLSCFVTEIGLQADTGLKSLSLNVYVTLTNLTLLEIQWIVFAIWLMERIRQSLMSAEVICSGLAMRRKAIEHGRKGQWIKASKAAPLQLPEVSFDSLCGQGPRGDHA